MKNEERKDLDLAVRGIVAEDMELLYRWANDPVTRKNSFSSEQIKYEDHIRWFSDALISDTTQIFILSLEDVPIGQFRLQYSGTEVVFSCSLDAAYRGQGFGEYIVVHGIKKVVESHKEISQMTTYVKKDNIASQKMLLSCGFQEQAVGLEGTLKFVRKLEGHTIRKEIEKFKITPPPGGGGG